MIRGGTPEFLLHEVLDLVRVCALRGPANGREPIGDLQCHGNQCEAYEKWSQKERPRSPDDQLAPPSEGRTAVIVGMIMLLGGQFVLRKQHHVSSGLPGSAILGQCGTVVAE